MRINLLRAVNDRSLYVWRRVASGECAGVDAVLSITESDPLTGRMTGVLTLPQCCAQGDAVLAHVAVAVRAETSNTWPAGTVVCAAVRNIPRNTDPDAVWMDSPTVDLSGWASDEQALETAAQLAFRS